MDPWKLPKDEIDSDLKRIPVNPQVLRQLLDACRDEFFTVEEFSSIIARDPSLTARLLRAANSAVKVRDDRVTNIPDAVFRLGLREIMNLAIAALMASGFRDRLAAYQQGADEFWRNALLCAAINERLARDAREAPATAYVCGLLHAVGKFFISWHCQRWGLNTRLQWQEFGGLDRQERSLVGQDHAEIGAYVLEKWELPAEVCEPIRWQFYPDFCPNFRAAAGRLHLAVHLAEACHVATVQQQPLKRYISKERLKLVESAQERARGGEIVLSS